MVLVLSVVCKDAAVIGAVGAVVVFASTGFAVGTCIAVVILSNVNDSTLAWMLWLELLRFQIHLFACSLQTHSPWLIGVVSDVDSTLMGPAG